MVLQAHPLICGDILSATGAIDVHTSIGPSLPIPVVQSCKNAGVLISILITACLIGSVAWATLLWRPPSELVSIILFSIVAVIVISFPYFSTTDAYAYALYGYEAGVMHVSPYYQYAFAQTSTSSTLHTLVALFPTQNSVRVANYGAIFIAIYGALALVARGSLPILLISMRILSAVSLLLLAIIAARAVPRNMRRRMVVVVLLQPLMIIEAIAVAHADVLMLLLCLLAYTAYRYNTLSASAVLFTLAAGVRSIAVLPVLTLAMYWLTTSQYHKLWRFISAIAISFGVLIAWSISTYHTFTLGTAPGINPFSSPAMLFAMVARQFVSDAKPFAVAQALFAMICLACAVLRGKYSWAALWILAALPTLHPWYTCWLLPVAALTNDSRFQTVAATVMFVAIFGEYTLMSRSITIGTAFSYVAAQWLLPAVTYLAWGWMTPPRVSTPALAHDS